VLGQRRGARRDASVKRWTVNSYVAKGYRGPDCGGRDRERRPRQLGKIDMNLSNISTAEADADRVPAGVARFDLHGRSVFRGSVVLPICQS
jgi:hypothetical protein